MKRAIALFVSFFFIVTVLTVNCFAYSGTTYAHLSQSNSTVQNLISFANNDEEFINSDFVVAQTGQYEYYIFYGDLNYGGSSVAGSEVKYICYSREGSGYDYSYVYTSGTESNLSLTVNHAVISNIEGLGSASALYEEYKSYDDNIMFFIFGLAVLVAIFFVVIRSSNK